MTPPIDVPAVVAQVRSAISALCRSRDLSSLEKLDAIDQIQRFADKKDAAIRAKIRKVRKAGQ